MWLQSPPRLRGGAMGSRSRTPTGRVTGTPWAGASALPEVSHSVPSGMVRWFEHRSEATNSCALCIVHSADFKGVFGTALKQARDRLQYCGTLTGRHAICEQGDWPGVSDLVLHCLMMGQIQDGPYAGLFAIGCAAKQEHRGSALALALLLTAAVESGWGDIEMNWPAVMPLLHAARNDRRRCEGVRLLGGPSVAFPSPAQLGEQEVRESAKTHLRVELTSHCPKLHGAEAGTRSSSAALENTVDALCKQTDQMKSSFLDFERVSACLKEEVKKLSQPDSELESEYTLQQEDAVKILQQNIQAVCQLVSRLREVVARNKPTADPDPRSSNTAQQ